MDSNNCCTNDNNDLVDGVNGTFVFWIDQFEVLVLTDYSVLLVLEHLNNNNNNNNLLQFIHEIGNSYSLPSKFLAHIIFCCIN